MSDSALGRYPTKHILEAALLAADEPLSVAQLRALFEESEQPSTADIGRALEELSADCDDRGVELKEVASGFRLQVKPVLKDWVARLWTERPPRYSRALLETLALIAYRQPITRGEIESVRGVSLSSNIIRTLQEREWIRIVGHRDVPGKPALFGTTKVFLDYFNLKSLDELPTLAELRDMETLEPELQFEAPSEESGAEDEQQTQGRGEQQEDLAAVREDSAATAQGDTESTGATDTDEASIGREADAAKDTDETDDSKRPV